MDYWNIIAIQIIIIMDHGRWLRLSIYIGEKMDWMDYNPVAINREDERTIVFWYDMLVDVFWF